MTEWHVLYSIDRHDAGIDHQKVDVHTVGSQRGSDLLQLVDTGDVGTVGLNATRRANAVPGSLQALTIPPDDDDTITLRRQLARQFKANARRTASDQTSLVHRRCSNKEWD